MLNLADLAKFSMFLPTAKKRKPNVSNHIHFLTHGLFVGGWGVKKNHGWFAHGLYSACTIYYSFLCGLVRILEISHLNFL